eukprot:2556159-Ditylum_brightwellii.AAC.1
MDKKLGKSRAYKLCIQPEEDNSPVKEVLRRQNVSNVDAVHPLVQDLIRGDALTAFNNKQAMFKEQTLDNFEHCLNAVTVGRGGSICRTILIPKSNKVVHQVNSESNHSNQYHDGSGHQLIS